ncbi:iron complex transport system substrate-binding protein [Tamaricihabitans halophyticus]|uniref:Iron complex transport system substrate-binding protein n=1 Tax=Tamaricihabitans halophyticus TaxID=1262583 RepID=A0A4V2SUF5_9PSEU|nr:ABC transporter substrate-binding protein [Tamaricihabitans halophyticus]TCP54376.1 iron complex transport system substrate-binding protein [Tamaricihabitans halophyticus]
MTRKTVIPAVLASGLLLASCGAEVHDESGAEQTVTVQNCGREIEYPQPQRAVAYDMSATEKVFALGLADRLRGIVLPSTADEPAMRSPYRADYESADVLSTDVLSREVVVEAKADWVLAGWNSGFSEERGITPALLDQLGIKSYMFTESCFNFGDQPETVPPLEALYTDLRQIGKIFGVEQRAERLVTDLQRRAAELRKTRPADPAQVFVYDSGTDQPFTSGNQTAPEEIISLAGGRNIFADLAERWTTVGWESVVSAKPEVIAVVDYGDQPVEQKIEFLKSYPALAEVPAVRNERFYVLDYGQAVSGPRNIEGAEQFAEYLRSIGR